MRMQMFSGSAVSDASNFYAFLLLSSPRWTTAHTHWLAAQKGVSVGVWKRCQQMLQPHTFKSSILFFFCLFFIAISLTSPRPSDTLRRHPSLSWEPSQQSNAPVCSWSFILSDLLPFRMDQVQVKCCAASLIRAVLMQNIGQDMLRITWMQQTYAYFSVSSISKTSTIKYKGNADLFKVMS